MLPYNSFQDLDISKRIPPKQLFTLLKVSSTLAASLDLAVVLQTAIESAVEVLGLETGAIYSLEEGRLHLGATTPPLPPELNGRLLQPENLADHPHLHQALTQKQVVCVTDAQEVPLSPAEQAIRDARRLRSILYIPLVLEDQAIGAMILGSVRKIREFCEDEVVLSRVLAYQVTLAVANARLFKSMQQANVELTQAYDVTLQGWSMALEMRDEETQGHTQRVTRLTEALSRKMGIDEPALVNIRRGALLHDIGKISVPDAILRKPGPLSAEEMAVMRLHPGAAYQFISQVKYLQPALDIPYCHHERWDGSGYPRGLKGEEIPLAARIFAVVDVFDALTSDRPYRPAWRVDDAVRYLREQAGRQFDPRVVEAFLNGMVEEALGDEAGSEPTPPPGPPNTP